ncbi:hypothetical protein ACO1O0_005917 [Amphichorda felina]
MEGQPDVHSEFEPVTGTWQYIVADPTSSKAIIIDPVLNLDPATQTITTTTADLLLSAVTQRGYQVEMILETHAHADHLTAASYLQSRLSQIQDHRPLIGIGKRIKQVQKLFGQRYGIPENEYKNVFDTLFDDDETFKLGSLTGTAIHLPGHTPDHLGYKIGDNVFVGDSLFHADIGSARCDFPGGSASDLYNSGRKLLALPDGTKIWTGHDYPPKDRDGPVAYLTVREHRERNKHLNDEVSREDYVSMRTTRDNQMAEPRLLHQSLQINIRAGRLPKPNEAKQRFVHLPLKFKVPQW